MTLFTSVAHHHSHIFRQALGCDVEEGGVSGLVTAVQVPDSLARLMPQVWGKVWSVKKEPVMFLYIPGYTRLHYT